MTSTAATDRNERLMNRLVEIIGSNDFDALGEVLHEDFVQEMPQSGEVVRGIDNYKAILAHYPGRDQTPIQGEHVRTIGAEPHYVMTPTFNLERVQGEGDNPVGVFTLRYPDGSRWWGIWFITIRDDKVARSLDFFAPEFPAPEWRAQWVEA